VLLDPAVPIDIRSAQLHTLVGAYVRSISFFGRSSKIDVVVPFAGGDWRGSIEGSDSSVARTGFGDPRVRLSVNFAGAPALQATQYGTYRQRTIVGASLQIILPLGQYDPARLINLGSNRRAFRPQIGASRAMGDWIVEAYVSGWLFGKNADFYGGNELTQQPLLAFKVHTIHTLPKRRIWFALGAGYALGGRVEINGVERDTRVSTFRFGFDVAVPFAVQHSFKFTAVTGIRHERGPDFDAVALTYQYMWGG
jgi:hypothetical protein